MEVRRLEDAEAWLVAVRPLLLEDEARHNIHFGLANTLMTHPEIYSTKHLWVVSDADRRVGAALQTPPYNLLLARPAIRGVSEALVETILGAGMRVPGVTAADPEARMFADAWCARTGDRIRRVMAQGIYALREVRDPRPTAGAPREATPDDLELVLGWNEAFMDEVVLHERGDPAARRRRIEAAFTSEGEGYWLWGDGDEPVSMTGFSRSTPNGCRIGPVYTPPELRGRGYATALVAHASRDQLAHGRRFCFLYTDMANPTSNAIYRRIGYELVCGSEELAFDPS
jgi:predicted GNAT family acetyltransferase